MRFSLCFFNLDVLVKDKGKVLRYCLGGAEPAISCGLLSLSGKLEEVFVSDVVGVESKWCSFDQLHPSFF